MHNMTMRKPSPVPEAEAGAVSDEVVLEARGLGVTYGQGPAAVLAVDGLDLIVRRGELVCLVGPSGCGKTTLLRSLAGTLTPGRGSIHVAGEEVRGPSQGLALVFQDYTRSLLPWYSVRKNVTFPLRAKGLATKECNRRGDAALAEVGLAGFEDKYPWQLSGGMQQRAAIARALAYEPAVLLLDEPFASVDAQARAELEDLVLRVQKDTGVTVLLVTHDIDESVYLANRVVVLRRRPTSVRQELSVGLGFPRDQLTTKANPEFVRLRTQVLELIQEESRRN